MGNSASTESTEAQAQSTTTTAPAEEQQHPQPSYYQMAKQGYQELVNAIIRPPRCEYSEQHLGPSSFKFCGKNFQRTDFEITNPRDMKICCSHWEPKERANPVLPCVIYMHGNSSSRLECFPLLSMLLSLGITVLAFDFAGSGGSEGDYVSLGYFEKDDLESVIKHLRDGGSTSTIALWGRSMGAATALLHVERDPSIAGMVLDSAFSSLVTLAEEMVEKGKEMGMPNIPSFVISMAIRWIRSSVKKQAGFDIYDLTPVQHADKCYIPSLFVAGKSDDFVQPGHSQRIYDQYAGDKNLVLVDGDHNSARPPFFGHSAVIFLKATLQIPEHWMLDSEGDFTAGEMPWSSMKTGRGGGGNFMSDFGGGDEEYLTYEDIIAMMGPSSSILEGQGGTGGEGVDGGLGMTTDRQENVRNALFSMLGDTGSNQRLNAQMQRDGSSKEDNDKDRDDTRGTSRADIDALPPAVTNAGVEWSCTVCTLMNPAGVVVCSACGCANYTC